MMIDKLTKAFAWLQIAIAPAIVGIGVGIFVWSRLANLWGIVIGSTVAVSSIIGGIMWANKMSRKNGSIQFMAKVSATPELDDHK